MPYDISVLFQQQFLIITDPVQENPEVVCISYETEDLTFVLEDLACPFGLCQFEPTDSLKVNNVVIENYDRGASFSYCAVRAQNYTVFFVTNPVSGCI